MTYMRWFRHSTCFRALALLGMTAFFLLVGAILLPLEEDNAMPRQTTAVSPR